MDQFVSELRGNGRGMMTRNLQERFTLAVTQTLSVGSHCFRVDLAGPQEGELVLLLHGYPNSRHSWREFHGPLSEHGFRTLAPDQRGYSPGARPVDAVLDYHYDRIVEDTLGFADALGVSSFHLVGHDWGGQIAWLTAARHPDRLRSLTVLSRPHPVAFAEALAEDPEQAKRSRHHKAFQDPGMASRLLANDAQVVRNTLCFERASGLSGKDGADGSNVRRRMSDELAGLHLSVLGTESAMNAALNWYRASFTGESALARPDVPAIMVPTLYVWGCEDWSVGTVAAEATARHIVGPYEFVSVEGAGHFLAEESPAAVLKAMLPHLARTADHSNEA